jgi:hypothetical protein
MAKKIVLLISMLLFFNIAFAEMCPSVKDLKQNNFNGWEAFDRDNGLPLIAVRLKEFKQQLNGFMLAEWMQNAPEGSARCYYSGKTSKKYIQAFLAKQRLMPNKAMNHWHQLSSSEVMRCKSKKIEDCLFQAY